MAVSVVLNAHLGEAPVDDLRNSALRIRKALPKAIAAADQMERTPCQHAGDRIEVGCVDVTADARSLERNRPGPAECVSDLRAMSEPHDAELFEQFRQR